MELLTRETDVALWSDVVRHAESRCFVSLKDELEVYLISLLIRYSKQPDVIQRIVATAFFEAMQKKMAERSVSLQQVGDICLLFAGLFPHAAQKRRVKLRYFVDLGRSAYSNISGTTSDIYGSLALEFVVLMDVLQSIRERDSLLPFEAFQQWQELGSQRAHRIFQGYTNVLPINIYKK